MLLKTVKEYMSNSSFHGLRFIAQDGVHWTERVFWVVTVLLSWYFSSTLIQSSWDGYQHNAISFVADTTYKEWNTAFPSVTICEMKNLERTRPAAAKYWETVSPDNATYDINLESVLQQLAYMATISYFFKEYCFLKDGEVYTYDEKMNCPLINLSWIAAMSRGSCEEVFKSCFWRDKEFDCCNYFLPLDTEFGVCYSLNNAHVNASYHPERHVLDTMSNFSTGPGKLSITLRQNMYMAYFHPREDVPSIGINRFQRELLTPKYPKHIWVSLLEVQNDPEVRETSVQQRKCRFMDENFLTIFEKYGQAPCVIECRKREQKRLCGCSLHLLPRTQPDEECTLLGAVCTADNHIHLSVMKNSWNYDEKRKGIKCSECIATCTEMEIQVTRKLEIILDDSNLVTRFELALEALPTERPRRIVVRGILDLVVSMGGAAGLLVGASLLSFVEFIYFFTLRLYGSYKAEKEDAEKEKKIRSEGIVARKPAGFPFGGINREYF